MTADVAIGSTLAGFRVERLLGRGAMGAVYLTEDIHLRRKVAVKVLAPELASDERFRRRFLVESQLAASLEHPHIVPIYAAGEAEEVLFLAMKYVEGYDLRELIDATDRVGDERALRVLAQVAGALDAAHGLGLVHRDVKPANVLIGAGEQEHAYVCDFGLAKHASTVASLTGERAFVGTIAYIAPEQIESGAVDARADVYALGCVLYECLVGAPPFDRDGDLQVVFAHLKEPPPLVTAQRPDLSDAVDEVLQKALAKEPDERFSTCGELVSAASLALKVEAPVVSTGARRTIPGVRTFLIADVRGYTSYTQEEGDEAAAALASSFAQIVRETVEARDGRLIELRGDEALVVFDSTRQALRAALAVQEGVAASELPRGVGIGLDAGEAVPVGEGYRGGALNLAARLCSLAGPGEILASETVLQLAETVEGIRYGERRVERVKGLARPVPLVEVLPEDRQVRKWTPRRLRRRVRRLARNRRIQLVAAVALVLATVAGAVVALTGGTAAAGAQIPENSLGLMTAEGKVTHTIAAGGADGVARGPGGYWAMNPGDGTVGRIDLAKHRIVKPLVSLGVEPGGFAAGQGYVWVVDEKSPTLLRINPQYNTVDRFHLRGADPNAIDTTANHGLAACLGFVWVAIADKVFKVAPQTGRVVGAIPVRGGTEIDCAKSSIWVTSGGFGTIAQIDPSIDQVVKTVKLHDWLGGAAFAGGFLWGAITPDDTLWKIDANGNILKTFNFPQGVSEPVAFGGYVWVGVHGRIARVDPTSDQVTYFKPATRPVPVAAGKGALFVATFKAPPPLQSLPADEVATFSLAEDYVDDTDPATSWGENSYRGQLAYATGAKLVNYPDAPAPRGSTLVPEVAATMPSVTDGGKAYTFRIRRGFVFSPPSNAPVTAETFKYSLERALSPKLGDASPGLSFLADIAGAQAFHDGKAAHVSGITARGDRLRIRLVAPAGDFLARLALPYFAAVPIGTPILPGGVQKPIPSAGPYYVADRFEDERLVLERNPNYKGPRPHRLERIVYETDDATRTTIARIGAGGADYAADQQHLSTFAQGGPLDERFGTQRLHFTPSLGIGFLQFNTQRGPFVSARLRRAVSYAIDRTALAGASGTLPAAQYVPRGMPGYTASDVYPLRPNLSAGRKLVRGQQHTAVLFTCTRPICTAQSRIIAANLRAIGIQVRVKAFENQYAAAARPGAAWDILTNGWGLDWADPSNVFDVLVGDVGYRPPWAPPPALADDRLDHELRAAAVLLPPKRYTAYAKIETDLLRHNPPFAAYENSVLPEFFSARMGCKVFQPVYGAVDIGALCVKASD